MAKSIVSVQARIKVSTVSWNKVCKIAKCKWFLRKKGRSPYRKPAPFLLFYSILPHHYFELHSSSLPLGRVQVSLTLLSLNRDLHTPVTYLDDSYAPRLEVGADRCLPVPADTTTSLSAINRVDIDWCAIVGTLDG